MQDYPTLRLYSQNLAETYFSTLRKTKVLRILSFLKDGYKKDGYQPAPPVLTPPQQINGIFMNDIYYIIIYAETVKHLV